MHGISISMSLWLQVTPKPLIGLALLSSLLVLTPERGLAQVAAGSSSFDGRFEAAQVPVAASTPDQSVQMPAAAGTSDQTVQMPAAANTSDQKELAVAATSDADPPSLTPPQTASGPAGYRTIAAFEAKRSGLAPEIADSVMAVESGYNPAAIGDSGEIGLMQILPSTARMLGFVGTNTDLAVPATNIHYGVMYLAQAWQLAGGDLCTAVMKYRAGHGETRFSYLSVNYCLAVRAKLFARGYPVTGSVPAPTFGEPGPAGCRKCVVRSRIGDVNLAALNSRLSTIVVQVRAGR
jgi:soluble lytic murein transglycosylase-like protein